MKHIKLQTVYDLLDLDDNILSQRGIKHFLTTLVMEFFNNKDFDVMEGFNTTDQDFLDSFRTAILGLGHTILLTDDTWIEVGYNAECVFEYNKTDESEVGLGGVNEICGVLESWLIITKITLFCGDGSVFDFTHNELVGEYLAKHLKIE